MASGTHFIAERRIVALYQNGTEGGRVHMCWSRASPRHPPRVSAAIRRTTTIAMEGTSGSENADERPARRSGSWQGRGALNAAANETHLVNTAILSSLGTVPLVCEKVHAGAVVAGAGTPVHKRKGVRAMGKKGVGRVGSFRIHPGV
jgi:hypothetical protein